MIGVANMMPEPLAAVGMSVEELVWFGMEELTVAEGHLRLWSWYCMELLAKVPVEDLPLHCSLSCPWNYYCTAA